MDNSLTKLDQKSIFQLIKIREQLKNLQIVELENVLDKIEKVLSRKCKKIGVDELLGKCFIAHPVPNIDFYIKFEGVCKEGILSCKTITYRDSKKIKWEKSSKRWVCGHYKKKDIWQLYKSTGQVDLIEISEKEFRDKYGEY